MSGRVDLSRYKCKWVGERKKRGVALDSILCFDMLSLKAVSYIDYICSIQAYAYIYISISSKSYLYLLKRGKAVEKGAPGV